VIDFGDAELADQWDNEPGIDSLQLAMRLHHLRQVVDLLAGHHTVDWDRLTLNDQDEEESVAVDMILFIRNREPDNPALLAEHVHDARPDSDRTWDELTNDERQIAIDFVVLLLEWLEREGPR
jgi:predicted GTPase